MGNCLFGGLGDEGEVIKVITSNGGVMEFYAPITVESITTEFPGHGIFRSHDLFWKALCHQEELLPGKSYYLLPLNNSARPSSGQVVRQGHIRSNSIPAAASVAAAAAAAPYRMSFDCSQRLLKRSHTEAFSRYNNNNSGSGFWKVKLVISPEQLLEILSQEGRTEELIDSVRTVAKCGNGVSPLGFSDHWSFSSSRNASSHKHKHTLLGV